MTIHWRTRLRIWRNFTDGISVAYLAVCYDCSIGETEDAIRWAYRWAKRQPRRRLRAMGLLG